jgi:hypothetical protein
MRCVALHFYDRANLRHLVIICSAVFVPMAGAVFRLTAGAPSPAVMVVDIIPEVLSGETITNSEPSLAVNPANPLKIAASAWIPEPLGGKTTPIFISENGGNTWSCRSTVPIDRITSDMTQQFGGVSNTLYVTTVHNDKKFDLIVCRSDRLAKNPMTPVGNRPGWIDQPYIAAATINKKDRVFVGCLDFNGPKGETATIVRSLDGTGSPPASDYTPLPIEFDDPLVDGSEIRSAISSNGDKVYAVFNRVTAEINGGRVGGVIVVRDDNGGNSRAPFTALREGNGPPGVPAVKSRTFAWNTYLGGDRTGGDLAIAVDPRNADNVYLVWSELVQAQPTLHVSRSGDAGVKWSAILHTVTNAKNPGLAMNVDGTLGFLYQQVDASSGREMWKTIFERTTDDFRNVSSLTLATFPVSEVDAPPTARNQPQFGDYLNLMSVGNDFYGIFSSKNVPDVARFPCGVTFQRRVDFSAKTVLGLNGNPVNSSTDPFFFKLADQPPIDRRPQK